jgi:PAS domain S-box-containing protein
MVVAAARDEEHLVMLRELGLSSSILVPLKARGRVLGAIRLLGAGTGRYYTADDVQLAEDLARRAAVAIENAQLHRALLEQQSELRLSHAAAHMGSWSWDLARQKIFWSDEFKALHGLPAQVEASFEGGRALMHPDDADRVMQELEAVYASGSEALSTEHRAIAADGRVLWLQTRGRIQRDAAGKAIRVAGITIDVTESRLAEQALRRTEKLAAAGRLAATVAHEVNNPLEALVNLIYLAQRTEGLPEEAALHLKIADGELSRMAHIVRQTLGFYRESSIAQKTNLDRLVAEVLELYRSRAGTRGLTLVQETPDGQAEAQVNAGEIKQVVANLISNAIDATPHGGTVRASVRRDGACVELAVSDTGTGISEANRKHLFEPFFTTKSDVGTGLGLWVSKGIVEKHGGTIVVDSIGLPGTTMRVRLPVIS